MATTHTVTNDFTAGDTAVADEVDQNFTDILTYLDDMDASNIKKTGTYIPVANITGLTKTQMDTTAVTGFVLDEDAMTSNSADAVPTQQSVKAYVDTQDAAGIAGQWHDDGSTVFNTTVTTANTWQDLDLNAKVGANVAMVFLEVKSDGAVYFYVKPKGYGGTVTQHSLRYYSGGLGNMWFDGADYAYTTMATNSSGVIQIAANTTAVTLTIKLVAYVH